MDFCADTHKAINDLTTMSPAKINTDGFHRNGVIELVNDIASDGVNPITMDYGILVITH